jgi:hypothetical protein
MSIKTFIQQQILRKRLNDAEVLVVYDRDGLYRALCNELADEQTLVVDASESSIESREAAMAGLQKLGKQSSKLKTMLVYVPAAAPVSDEQRRVDPFSVYVAVGDYFPKTAGEEYQSICLRAKSDDTTEVRRVFAANPRPDFSVIDAIGTAGGWPILKSKLGRESTFEILFGLLSPSKSQVEKLGADDSWVSEAKEVFQRSLGLKLISRSKKQDKISQELWRYVLFSEFTFDLPEALPNSLQNIPRASEDAQPLIESLCDSLRTNVLTQQLYVDRALEIEKELNLATACASIDDLGERDTFAFEERSFFGQAMRALEQDDIDTARAIIHRHSKSVWVARGESNAQWELIRAAVNLIEAAADGDRQLPDHKATLESLIGFYTGSLREVDRLHREFHEAFRDLLIEYGTLKAVAIRADKAYRTLMDKVQDIFIRLVEKSNWPPQGLKSNARTFDDFVAARVKENSRKVAYILIDALRYELGVALQKQLADDAQITLHLACAQMPTVTPVGMASLLPNAHADLKLKRVSDRVVPTLGDVPLKSVSQRLKVLQDRFGQRFQESSLGAFLSDQFSVGDTVDLLVIRTNRMDSSLEDSNEEELDLDSISRTLKRIRAAVYRLRHLGFDDAVIATDHGFFLNTSQEAGNVALKPPGTWVTLHDRCLLGAGHADTNNLVVSSEQLGIRGEFSQVAVPRALVAYRDGLSYFHGGLSLQEALLPVIQMRLKVEEEKLAEDFKIVLSYRSGLKSITSRLPVIEVAVKGGGMLFDNSVELLIEAQDGAGEVVGEAKPGDLVNAATGTVTLQSGQSYKIPLRMDMNFEGSFSVKAMNPETLETYSTLELSTDYTV